MDDETRAQIERSVEELAEGIAQLRYAKLRTVLENWCASSGVPFMSTPRSSDEEPAIHSELSTAIAACINSRATKLMMDKARDEAVGHIAQAARDVQVPQG